MKIYQFILILILVYLAGIFTLLDLEKFPIRTEYVRIEFCPVKEGRKIDLSSDWDLSDCLKLGGIPIIDDNPYTTEPITCEYD